MLVGQNGRSERLCWELRQPCRLIRRCSSERMQVVPVEDQQNYGEVVGVTEQPAPASGVVVGVLTEQPVQAYADRIASVFAPARIRLCVVFLGVTTFLAWYIAAEQYRRTTTP